MKKNDTVEEYWTEEDVLDAERTKKSSSISLFQESLSNYLGVDKLHAIPSARWGLYWLLSNISRLGQSGLVLAPAFNCIVVADAIRKSGHQLEGYDFSGENGSVDWGRLADRIKSKDHVKPVAVIVTHFFGVPVNWLAIREMCRELQIFIIEDCAHTLGGRISGYMSGTLSDASIYSFNYDKPISLGWGGALILNNNLLKKQWIDGLFEIPDSKQERSYLKKFLLAMEGRRSCIGEKSNLMNRVLSKIGLRKPTSFNMPNVGIGALRSELGIKLINRFEDIRSIRNSNSIRLRNLLPSSSVWHVGDDVDPSWLKMKVKVASGSRLKIVPYELQIRGYRAGNFNWPLLIDSSQEFPNAKLTSQRWIDVPIHQNLNNNDIENLALGLSGVEDA